MHVRTYVRVCVLPRVSAMAQAAATLSLIAEY